MYRQHSIEVMLQQAFRQLDRYLSREHMDSLGEWRNELDEQLTNGTAGSGALMQLFTYYGKTKIKIYPMKQIGIKRLHISYWNENVQQQS